MKKLAPLPRKTQNVSKTCLKIDETGDWFPLIRSPSVPLVDLVVHPVPTCRKNTPAMENVHHSHTKYESCLKRV